MVGFFVVDPKAIGGPIDLVLAVSLAAGLVFTFASRHRPIPLRHRHRRRRGTRRATIDPFAGPGARLDTSASTLSTRQPRQVNGANCAVPVY